MKAIIAAASTSNGEKGHMHAENENDHDGEETDNDEDSKSSSSSHHSNSSASGLIIMQYSELVDLMETASKINAETSHGYIRAHLDMINQVWGELRIKVLTVVADGDKANFDYAATQKRYLETVGKLNDLLCSNTKVNRASDSQFSLPQLKLPEFHGKLGEWRSFISLYDRMVHNNPKIDSGLKIVYLKSCIKSEAAKVINHVDAAPENYETCYELLKRRYDNKRQTLAKLLDNILNFPKMKFESAEQLKALHDVANESVLSIKNLGIKTENWDPLLTHILIHKLDSSTVIHYECQLKDVREPQSLEEFFTYVENRFMAIQSANSKVNNIAPMRGENRDNKQSEKKFHDKANRAFCFYKSLHF